MENFKKGLMTTMGVMTGLSLYVAFSGLFKKSDKKDDKEAEKETK